MMIKKKTLSLSLAALCLSLAGAGTALAQTPTPTPHHAYKEAIEHCKSLTGEAKSNCFRDARAAHSDKHRKHTHTDRQTLEKNRLARCNRLPESQRQQCIEHMQGHYKMKKYGSVQGGGMLRQSTIEIPGEPYEVKRAVPAHPHHQGKRAMPSPHTPAAGERVITPIQ